MKKKLLCGALALIMAFSALPLSACKKEPNNLQNQDQGQNQGGQGNQGNQGNQGSQGNQGDQGGQGDQGNQGGQGDQGGQGGESEPKEILPGTVITDEATKRAFFRALSTKEIDFSYSLSASEEEEIDERSEKTFKAEGAVEYSEGKLSFDLFASIKSEEPLFFAAFLRDGKAYTAEGALEGEFDAGEIKKSLKDEDDPVYLTEHSLKEVEPYLKEQVCYRLLCNLPSLFEGTLTKTEGGYSLRCDLLSEAKTIFSDMKAFASVIDRNPQETLGVLYRHDFLKKYLSRLFEGITGEELYTALQKFLPEEISETLPEPNKNSTALSYGEKLLTSGAFFSELFKEREGLEEFKTFSEVPLDKMIAFLTGEETSDWKLAEFLEDFETEFEKKIVETAATLLGIEGEISEENIELSVEFSFGDEKELLGFSADGRAAGKITPIEEPEEEQEKKDEGAESGASEASASGEDERNFFVSFKVEAVCGPSEIFSLSGAKVKGEEGTKTLRK